MDKRIYVYFILIQLILIGCENSSGKQKNTLSEDITEEINIENYEWMSSSFIIPH
jgi:hypothetical protein